MLQTENKKPGFPAFCFSAPDNGAGNRHFAPDALEGGQELLCTYGMSTRIPPSLAWLIDKRARLAGKIENVSKVIESARKLEIKRAQWQVDLAAIDRALEMHEIRVDAECIFPIAPRKQRIRLPYGALSKALLQFLRESGDKPLSIDVLTIMLINRCVSVQEKLD